MIRMLVFLALVLTRVAAAAGCEQGYQARQTSAVTAPAVPMN